MEQALLPELATMQAIAQIVENLTPAERKRIAAWFLEYASQESTSFPAAKTARDVDTASSFTAKTDVPSRYRSFTEFYETVVPKTGAQKATVAGYWLETEQSQRSWKAFDVNKLLKSIEVKVSSMSIVLTNAVKATDPLVLELDRSGEGEHSRKTFCLSESGIAYVLEKLS